MVPPLYLEVVSLAVWSNSESIDCLAEVGADGVV